MAKRLTTKSDEWRQCVILPGVVKPGLLTAKLNFRDTWQLTGARWSWNPRNCQTAATSQMGLGSLPFWSKFPQLSDPASFCTGCARLP